MGARPGAVRAAGIPMRAGSADSARGLQDLPEQPPLSRPRGRAGVAGRRRRTRDRSSGAATAARRAAAAHRHMEADRRVPAPRLTAGGRPKITLSGRCSSYPSRPSPMTDGVTMLFGAGGSGGRAAGRYRRRKGARLRSGLDPRPTPRPSRLQSPGALSTGKRPSQRRARPLPLLPPHRPHRLVF